jgi:hypothetical protein
METIKFFIKSNNGNKNMIKCVHKYGEYMELKLYKKMFFIWYKDITLKILFDNDYKYSFLMPSSALRHLSRGGTTNNEGHRFSKGIFSYRDNEINIDKNFKSYVLKLLYCSSMRKKYTIFRKVDGGGVYSRIVYKSDKDPYTYNPKYEMREKRLKKILTKNED